MQAKSLKLWKFNKITGYWQLERDVTKENQAGWLKIYQQDEPDELFKVSKIKPK